MSAGQPAIEETVTLLLRRVRDAEPGALDQLFERVYPDLKRVARHVLRYQRAGQRALSATTLVHDACVRLLRDERVTANDRRHFFRLFCCAMEREWVDRVRRNRAVKRGGGRVPEELREDALAGALGGDDFLDLREALAELEARDPAAAEVVRLRYYCGATLEDTAEVTGVSLAVVRRDWTYAKSWLHERLTRGDGDGGSGSTSEDCAD